MKRLTTFVLAIVLLAMLAVPAVAQGPEEGASKTAAGGVSHFAVPLGAGLVIIGSGYAIGKIGTAAVEAMARQPEVAGNVQTAMIIAAALIEGATFFALIVCWLGG